MSAPRGPMVAQQGQPLGPFRTELGSQPSANPRRESRAGPSARDGQQQVAAAHLGDAVEVAQLRLVLDVDQHSRRARQRGKLGSGICRQANDPQCLQRCHFRAGWQKIAERRLRRGLKAVGVVREEQQVPGTAATQLQKPPERRLAPAGHGHRHSRWIECNRNHKCFAASRDFEANREAFSPRSQASARIKYFFLRLSPLRAAALSCWRKLENLPPPTDACDDKESPLPSWEGQGRRRVLTSPSPARVPPLCGTPASPPRQSAAVAPAPRTSARRLTAKPRFDPARDIFPPAPSDGR